MSLIINSAIDPKINDGILYHLDLSDPSTYKTSCYEVLNSKWRVDNDYCFLETSTIHLPGYSDKELFDIPVNISIKGSGNLESDDFVLLQYINLSDNKWITIDSISGNLVPVNYTIYSYLLKAITSGALIKFRLSFKTNAQNEELTLQCASNKDFCIGSPFISGTIQQYVWSYNPVNLSLFSAKNNSKDIIELFWETYSEYNNKFFTVERSLNGIDFNKVYTTLGKKYSNTKVSYNFIDTINFDKYVFYRLMQTSTDNKCQYFDVVIVSNVDLINTEYCKINVDPNPCVGKCLISIENCNDSLKKMPLQFNLIDALGNITFINFSKDLIDSSTYKFNVDNSLSPGIFIIKSNEKIYQNKL
ncbi:MAG: hypothetical protein A2046_16525 [Bacteroidetes bacterium GWA2_30_7]|nr:MAG: hypothetical protein A2046_16525 [Bacteroidetes bacterium GWA2_30_7]